uniref:Neuropeptide receptor n=1 Tax=Diaphorina citri TaxID=121845 RepID=A0A2U9PFW5_DIACI|nr:neuropeptide receptor [Diaphorina citri]
MSAILTTGAPLTEQNCNSNFATFNFTEGTFCNWTWDGVYCWPPTRANSTIELPCPVGKGLDPTKFAFRRCSSNGTWLGKTATDFHHGWTNYTGCYTSSAHQLLMKLFNSSEEEGKRKIQIAENTRSIEIAGLCVSLFALLISIGIFCRFRSLRNNRTRIHKNLFFAMIIQVLVRLALYIDQAIISNSSRVANLPRFGIENTQILCEASYVLLEYARTASFMWMFIEGFYLNNMVTVTVFQDKSYYCIYKVVGWGIPLIMTGLWALVTAYYMREERCWWGYNLTSFFWILEGPRLAAVSLNFLFLLNIIRVLVVKLRQSHTTELEQLRKGVRAAIVLVPLLGITNVINMTEAPIEHSVWRFLLWSYTTHFLTSFQGFFVAVLYCFFNGEVRMAVNKGFSTYMMSRQQTFPTRRNSVFVSNVEPDSADSNEFLSTSLRRFCCRQQHNSTPQEELLKPVTKLKTNI